MKKILILISIVFICSNINAQVYDKIAEVEVDGINYDEQDEVTVSLNDTIQDTFTLSSDVYLSLEDGTVGVASAKGVIYRHGQYPVACSFAYMNHSGTDRDPAHYSGWATGYYLFAKCQIEEQTNSTGWAHTKITW